MAKKKIVERVVSSYFGYPTIVNIVVGMGVGMLLTYPLAGAHPVRWGVSLVVIGILAQIVPLILK